MTLLSMLDRFEQAAVTYKTSTKKADRDELHAARRAIMEAFADVEAERDESVNWSDIVERHGTDQFDDLAEAWLALPAIKRITAAVTSVFTKWASDELMERFRAHQLSMFHMAYVEGCLTGVKAAEARAPAIMEAFAERPTGGPELLGWRYSINYGPDGEENWANLITPEGDHVANIRTHHAMRIVAALSIATDERLVKQIVEKIEAEFDEWIDVTGAISRHNGWYHECKSFIQDTADAFSAVLTEGR